MKLRKVMFKEWIPIKYHEDDDGFKTQFAKTGCWSKEYTGAGLFHKWGCAYEEFESGPGNYTVAIVELPNGEITEILPSNIKFMDFPVY